jgi:hypothetical protein
MQIDIEKLGRAMALARKHCHEMKRQWEYDREIISSLVHTLTDPRGVARTECEKLKALLKQLQRDDPC